MTQEQIAVEKEKKKGQGGVEEFIKSIIIAVLLAVTVHTVAYKPFNIPSGSMKPTLLIGDHLFVSKFTYGYSHFSLPFSPPLFSGRILGKEPKRGDVFVFRGPHDPGTDYIKRVVGLPGDRIQMKDGILHINDKACPLERIEDFHDIDEDTGESVVVPQYIETLPNGVKHRIIKYDPFGTSPYDNTQVYTVPEGHFFGMGDNRDRSSDSRVLKGIGYIPYEYIVGRAEIIFFSTTARLWEVWKWPTGIRYKKFFEVIR
jgi:signal peptidase I